MPGRDGYGVAEFVKRSSEHVAQTRVVLLTGAFEPVEELRSRQLGIDGVLAKPFEPQVAIGLVKRLLAQTPRFPSESGVWAEGGNESQEAGASAPAVQAAAAIGESRVATDVPGIPPADASQDATAPPAALDDYFQRLDAALSSAGLEPSRSLRSALHGVTDAPSDVKTVVVAAPVPRAMVTLPQADDPSPRAGARGDVGGSCCCSPGDHDACGASGDGGARAPPRGRVFSSAGRRRRPGPGRSG